MKRELCLLVAVLMLCIACTSTGWTHPADSPEAAGITPVTGDITPWRAFGPLANMNYDNQWALALPDGNLIAIKRGADPGTPGVIGGTEFMLLSPTGEALTPPTHGAYQPDGSPLPYVDFNNGTWGAFTVGAGVDKVNGAGFVVNNQAAYMQANGLPLGDVLGDEAGSILQFFHADGSPNGSIIAPFGGLSNENEGSWRDIHSAYLSNGNGISVAENRQFTDSLLDSVGAAAGEVAVAAIVNPQGETVVAPFVVHVDENNQYIGTGGSSLVFGNVVAFDGGFVIDHGAGIRWYNNDGTPTTPSQNDHQDLYDAEAFLELDQDWQIYFPTNTGGRGDSRGMAANADTVVRSVHLDDSGVQIGALIYYNTDGTTRNHVRFDDTVLEDADPKVDRCSCDIDSNGNVFVVWEDEQILFDSDFPQIFGRFFDSEGNPAGPSFPVYENWDPTGLATVDYGNSTGVVPRGAYEQPRASLNNQVGMVINATNIMPDFPDATIQQLAEAFAGVAFLTEPVVRIFENPFYVDVDSWELH